MDPHRPGYQLKHTPPRAAAIVMWDNPPRLSSLINSTDLNSTREAGIAPAAPETRRLTDHGNQREAIQGEWQHLCALARQRWSQLTDDDLPALEGNFEQLVGRIQQKTGEARDSIEGILSDMSSRGSSAVAHASEAVGQYANHVGDQIHERYDSAQGLVRSHPTETVIAALGIGLVAGLITGLALAAPVKRFEGSRTGVPPWPINASHRWTTRSS